MSENKKWYKIILNNEDEYYHIFNKLPSINRAVKALGLDYRPKEGDTIQIFEILEETPPFELEVITCPWCGRYLAGYECPCGAVHN